MVGKMSDENIVEQDLNPDDDTLEQEVPLFMQEDDEQEQEQASADGVPVSTHVAMKRKLKSKLRDTDSELQELRAENERLKQSTTPTSTSELKRPVESDFDTDDEYLASLEKYEADRLNALLVSNQEKQNRKRDAEKFSNRIAASVDSHLDRAASLIEKHSISPDVYHAATETVKTALDDIHPGMNSFDLFLDVIGEGSEKTIFAIGRNKAKLAMLKETLHDDKSGLKAAFLLGQETARLNGVKARTSSAPAPGAQVAGDEQGGKNVAAMRRKFNKLCDAGKTSEAFALRRKAKQDKIDVKGW